MEDLVGEIELRVKLEEKRKELLQKSQCKEIQKTQEEQNYLNESPNNAHNPIFKRSEPTNPEKIKQHVEAIKRKAWCLGETLHMDEGTAHIKKKRKWHSIPLVSPNNSSHASITLSQDENVVQVVVKSAQPEYKRGNPIEVDNKGHQLLKRLGWRENSGLGRNENGIVQPLIPIIQNNQKGLGSKTKQDTQVHNFCEVCNKLIPEASWSSHLNGKKHKHRVHYVQMLEQLAPHLLPEERHQLLDEDEESKDNDTPEIDSVNNTVNKDIVNDITASNNNNQSDTMTTSKNDTCQPVILTLGTVAKNNNFQTKFIEPMPRTVLVNTSTPLNPVQATQVQPTQSDLSPQPSHKTTDQPSTKSEPIKDGEVKPPLLAPIPLPPDGNHQWLLCDVCKIHMYPQNWNAHINGKGHQKNLKKLVVEKQIAEENANVQLLPEKDEDSEQSMHHDNRFHNNRRTYRGRFTAPRYSAAYQHTPLMHNQPDQRNGVEYFDAEQGHQGAPLFPPPHIYGTIIPQQPLPQFFPSQIAADPTIFPAHINGVPAVPPNTNAVVSMIRDIIAQRIKALQQQQQAPPDPSRIFEY